MSLKKERIEKIQPLHDKVLIKRLDETENKTSGGIYIPEQSKERAQIGKVIAVGPGKILSNGTLYKMTVKVGDEVFFGKYSGAEISEEYIMLREDEIIGIL
jgi:chaperonin GroES